MPNRTVGKRGTRVIVGTSAGVKRGGCFLELWNLVVNVAKETGEEHENTKR